MIRVVTGPPCSGKSTYVAEHAGPEAVVLDVDRIAHALGYPSEHIDWSDAKVHPARSAAMIARASLLKRAASLGPEVWVVSSSREVVRSLPMVAPADVVELDPGVAECVARAQRAGRSPATVEQIKRWYGVGSTPTGGRTSVAW